MLTAPVLSLVLRPTNKIERAIPMAKTKLTPRPHFRLHIKHGVAIGPGKAQLLGQIAELGSITAAGRAMGMAYRTA